jgi:hypothetical protein
MIIIIIIYYVMSATYFEFEINQGEINVKSTYESGIDDAYNNEKNLVKYSKKFKKIAFSKGCTDIFVTSDIRYLQILNDSTRSVSIPQKRFENFPPKLIKFTLHHSIICGKEIPLNNLPNRIMDLTYLFARKNVNYICNSLKIFCMKNMKCVKYNNFVNSITKFTFGYNNINCHSCFTKKCHKLNLKKLPTKITYLHIIHNGMKNMNLLNISKTNIKKIINNSNFKFIDNNLPINLKIYIVPNNKNKLPTMSFFPNKLLKIILNFEKNINLSFVPNSIRFLSCKTSSNPHLSKLCYHKHKNNNGSNLPNKIKKIVINSLFYKNLKKLPIRLQSFNLCDKYNGKVETMTNNFLKHKYIDIERRYLTFRLD